MWENLPVDVIHMILKYTGKVVYRDGKYIDINKLVPKRRRYLEKVCKPHDIDCCKDNSFYYEMYFKKGRYQHGLCYDYNYSYREKFEVCYFVLREPKPDEEGTAWVQIRTVLV